MNWLEIDMILHDPLLDKIAKLKEQDAQKQFNQKKIESERIGTKVTETVTWFQKAFYILMALVSIVWINFAGPVVKFFSKLGMRFIAHLIRMWKKYACVIDEFGNRKFKPLRGGVFIVSMAICYFAAFIALDLTYYTTLYLLTANKDEVVYMTNSQEVDPNRDTYSAQGCESLPCDQESSVYFRIDPILFNQVYTMLHTGKIFYPDYVAAAIPPTLTKCVITSFGVRIKTLMRGFDIYPYLIKASCSPIVEK